MMTTRIHTFLVAMAALKDQPDVIVTSPYGWRWRNNGGQLEVQREDQDWSPYPSLFPDEVRGHWEIWTPIKEEK